MAEFPSLPIFTDALIGDTLHLSNAQFGSYMLLLIVAWRTKQCCLPDDDVSLARYARMDRRTWRINKSLIMGFWKLGDDQNWRQGRLTDERNFVYQLRSKNAEAGRASALKNKGRHSTSVQPEFNQTSTPTPTPTPILSNSYELDKGNFVKNGAKKNGKYTKPSSWKAEGERLAEKYLAEAMAVSGQSQADNGDGANLHIAAPIRKDNNGTGNAG